MDIFGPFILLAIAPLILVPIEIVFPYPFIIEELIKLVAVLGWVKISKKNILLPIIGGFLFSLTETILYINNIQIVNQPNIVFKRLIFTGGMHILTTTLIYLGFKKNTKLGLFGFVLSITIHYCYNYLI